MPSKYTIQSALAFIAITGSKRRLHTRTTMWMGRDLVGFQCEDLSRPAYFLTEAGMQQARRSRLWKAHEHMLSLGFQVVQSVRHKPGFISYVHPSNPYRHGFITNRGNAYATLDDNPIRWLPSSLVASFKNG